MDGHQNENSRADRRKRAKTEAKYTFNEFTYHLFSFQVEDFPKRRVSISGKDRPLIDALIAGENTLSPKKRHTCNGRFLTMHKRRRKKLQTRNLVFEPAVLDDILHGQVLCILRHVGNWRFNAFLLETVTGGKSSFLCYHDIY